MDTPLIIHTLVVGQLATNCYIVHEKAGSEALIVDPGDDAQYISQKLTDLGLSPKQIVATHGHFDHILGAWELQNMYNLPFSLHKKDEFLLKRMQETAIYFLGHTIADRPPQITEYLSAEKVLQVGKTRVQVIETPGHTPGSVCLHYDAGKQLLSGDTLFAHGGVGRTDFSYSSPAKLQDSLRLLFQLPDETQVYSGHGESTHIRDEWKFHAQHS